MVDTPVNKTPAELLEDAGAHQDVVEVPRCEGTIHVWSSLFASGDACACGRFVLGQGEDGRLRTIDSRREMVDGRLRPVETP